MARERVADGTVQPRGYRDGRDRGVPWHIRRAEKGKVAFFLPLLFIYLFFFAGRRRCHEIQTERWGRLHAALPHSSAALEWVKALVRSTGFFPHFGLFQQGTAAVIVTTAEQSSYLSLLCSATLLTVGTTLPSLRSGSQAHKHRLGSNKLALAICINKLSGVPRGKGCPACACVHSAALTLC